MSCERRIATMIDGENISHKQAEQILNIAAELGTATTTMVFGNPNCPQMKGWIDASEYYHLETKFAQKMDSCGNYTDMLMAITATEIACSGDVNGIVLVTSDCDFTILALKLRNIGLFVYGIGESKTNKSLVNACDEFISLDTVENVPPQNQDSITETYSSANVSVENQLNIDCQQLDDLERIKEIVVQILSGQEKNDGWMYLSRLGQMVKKMQSSSYEKSKNGKFKKLIQSIDCLEMRTECLDGKHPHDSVRIKRL